MLRVDFDSKEFQRDMQNIVDYSIGFLDGARQGKVELLQNIGGVVVEGLKQFIDTNARMSPQALHHVYEWYQTGSPAARLFDIEYRANRAGLSFNSTFRQSVSIQKGSRVPFYNKAEIMENGVPVTITPKPGKALVFESMGETVFTKRPVTVSEPGGDAVAGSYERVFEQFFGEYFSQSFLRSSGILDHLNDPTPFKSNLSKAKNGGRSVGISTGYRWVSRIKGGVE
jgi:hypothetical protein